MKKEIKPKCWVNSFVISEVSNKNISKFLTTLKKKKVTTSV